MMYLLDKQTVEHQALQFESNGVALTDMIATVLAGVNKDEVIQYILAMLDELLIVQPRIAGYFHELLVSSKGYNDPFGPLMKLLTRSSLYALTLTQPQSLALTSTLTRDAGRLSAIAPPSTPSPLPTPPPAIYPPGTCSRSRRCSSASSSRTKRTSSTRTRTRAR